MRFAFEDGIIRLKGEIGETLLCSAELAGLIQFKTFVIGLLRIGKSLSTLAKAVQ